MRVAVPGASLLVGQVAGAWKAYLNVCRHRAVPLDFGARSPMSDDARFLLCHQHGAIYRLSDGEWHRRPVHRRESEGFFSRSARAQRGLLHRLRRAASAAPAGLVRRSGLRDDALTAWAAVAQSMPRHPSAPRGARSLFQEHRSLVREHRWLVQEHRSLVQEHRSLVHERRSLVHEHRWLVHEHRWLVQEHRWLVEESLCASAGDLGERNSSTAGRPAGLAAPAPCVRLQRGTTPGGNGRLRRAQPTRQHRPGVGPPPAMPSGWGHGRARHRTCRPRPVAT